MTQISPYLLWLGHSGDVQDLQSLFDNGIQVVVQLAAEETAIQPPRELTAIRIPLLDGPDNPAELLYLASSTVATLLKLRLRTLVSCGNGLSRSPAIAAAAISMVEHQPPEECLKRVVAKHHPCDLTPVLWEDVVRLLPAVR